MSEPCEREPGVEDGDAWYHVEIETDAHGETITHGRDATGEFVVLEVFQTGGVCDEEE